MTENFCYNQIGINHILKQFGDAISNKQYKNPIPYDTYRKIRNGFKNIFISFDCGDILVKAESETLFHTSYKDNGFGQFTEPGVVALSPYGIAVRSSKGEYLTYNAATGATVDVTGFTFDFQKMIYKMPAAIKDLRAGDMVLHRGKPMYVQSVEEDGIHCIDILNSEAKVIVPVTNMFGFNFVTKVVSLMNFNAAQPSAENPFGNLMPFMMMSSIMGDDSDNDFSKMMGSSNPFTAMFTPQDK